MATKSDQKSDPTATKQKPGQKIPGVRVFKREGKKSPYCVQWLEPVTRKKRLKSFETEDEQLDFATTFAADVQRQDQYETQFNKVKWRKFLDFEQRIGGIENLESVYRTWVKAEEKKEPQSIDDLGESFLLSKTREGISKEQIKRYEQLFKDLKAGIPDTTANEITGDKLTTWIDRQPIEPITKNNIRKKLSAFFGFCVRKRYLSENPVDLMDKWGVPEKPVGILTPEEGRKFIEANKNHACIGRLALEAFAGLRHSSAKRIKKDHINFEDQGIELPGLRVKTKKRIYVDGFPRNLWEWISSAPDECWTMPERFYQQEKIHAFIRADIPHPHNCLRHSFATYHVAKYKNVGKTATLLCHTNIQTLNRYYRGKATHSQGKEWFTIRP